MTGDAQLQIPAALTHVQRSHSLGTCASLDSTMTQCNTAHVSLNHCMEAEDNVPQILKERAAARGWGPWNPQVHLPEKMEVCLRG